MRKSMFLVLAAVVVLAATPALAELQNVIVGGQVRIRGNYYMNTPTNINRSSLQWPAGLLSGRSIGTGLNYNAPGVVGLIGWDDKENSLGYVEHRTRLNVKADFSNEVGAFIEIDSYDIWGEDFRSDYVTGADFRAATARAGTADDVEIYQSYIEANEMFGLPLRLRVGRQELSFGSEWLVGVNDTSSGFTGLSFDAVRLTYATDMFSVDAFMAELAEGGAFEEDEDVWLYGVYGSYLGLEDIVIDAYWLWLRDAQRLPSDTDLTWFGEWWEDIFGIDDYDPTNLHTVGLRGAGTIGAFDFEAEFAYQFGDADSVGFRFRPYIYGDDGADFSAWAANLEVGYTFDMAWQPRVWVGGAYFDGEDNRDISWWEWISPFSDPEASVSFNRLFSNWEYSQFLDRTDLSNVWLVRGGVQAMPTESIELALVVTYFQALEEFDAPAHITLGGWRIPIAPFFSFWTMENDSDLGIETGLTATYHYSEDLVFEAGWAHLFVDDGATDGQYVLLNGLGFTGGTSDDDADYLYLETRIQF